MGFQTPQYKLTEFLDRTRSGRIQLPDFQRGYKWDDERIRSLLGTILMGHPLGVVMLLRTGNAQVRFKPKPIEGADVPPGKQPDWLLLDGQQRLTSLTQALTGQGVVNTKDSRGKLMSRRYYLKIDDALSALDRIDDAVVSIPGDGVVRTNFDRDIILDLSTEELERENGYFPLRLLSDTAAATAWLFKMSDPAVAQRLFAAVLQPAGSYEIPAIELDEATSRAAVATVFEKVNTGGLSLNVFELLTATFAGDPSYFAAHGTDFRLNDDWQSIREKLLVHPVLSGVESIDFLQAITLLATRQRALAAPAEGRSPSTSARRSDVLRLTLADYLTWRDKVREAFLWAATYLADHSIFDPKLLPYAKQLVPLVAIKVVLGDKADAYAVRERLDQWFWCGILGELYGGANETRFARDLDEVPGWALGQGPTPRTVVDCTFAQSRLLSLRTRNAAAYKGLAALVLRGASDWIYNQALGKAQYVDLSVDIHHIFPRHWCAQNDVDYAQQESIINKTTISARTNRKIGGKAPSQYLQQIQSTNGLDDAAQDAVLASHSVAAATLRADDFGAFFAARAEALSCLVEQATGKPVQRDPQFALNLDEYDPDDAAVLPTDDERAEELDEEFTGDEEN